MTHDPLQNIQVPILGNLASIVMERAAVPQQVLCYIKMSTIEGCCEGSCRQGMALRSSPDDDFQIPAAAANVSSYSSYRSGRFA